MSAPLDERKKPTMHEVLSVETLAREALTKAAEVGFTDAADGAAEAWGLADRIFPTRLDEPYREAWPAGSALPEDGELEEDPIRVAPVGAFREFADEFGIPFVSPLSDVATRTEAYGFIAPIPVAGGFAPVLFALGAPADTAPTGRAAIYHNLPAATRGIPGDEPNDRHAGAGEAEGGL